MKRYSLFCLLCILAIQVCGDSTDVVDTKLSGNNEDKSNLNETATNLSTQGEHGADTPKKKTIAAKVETMVKKEFAVDVKEAEEGMGVTYNQSANSGTASMETVVRVRHKHEKPTGNSSIGVDSELGQNHSRTATAGLSTGSSNNQHDIESDVDRMIDSHDNEFVLSKPKELAALTLDPVFIQDLTILYTSAALMGLLFEYFGQPVINGYFVAGSIVGTGGFMLIKELVQVQSLAQLGVQLLLFHLGLEFSLSKMRSVGAVALIGGLLEMSMFVVISLVVAYLIGASLGEGIFMGALLSFSSTCVVANCLESSKATTSQYGKITIGTLILQDCTVGVMFAVMPLIGQQQGNNAESDIAISYSILAFVFKLAWLICLCVLISKYALPPAINHIDKFFSQELFQILLLSYCCLCALMIGWLGLSHELGAFAAGCMLSSSQQAPTAIRAVEGARNIFTTLFMASIGLLISPAFLLEHVVILTCSVLAVITCKTIIVSIVVQAFKFDMSTSLLVGFSLAQISEFAFVLLSMAVDYRLLEVEMYLLLLGVTALSLLVTPVVMSISQSWLQNKSPSCLKDSHQDSGPDDETSDEDGQLLLYTTDGHDSVTKRNHSLR